MDKYTETLNYLHSLSMYSNPPHTDLRKIKELCELLDNPQDSYKIIHIAGTNGKGSTTAMLSNIFIEMGYKTGRFISPYIYDFTERISINNSDISEEDVIYYTGKIKKILEENNIPDELMPNEFMFITLMAFLYYKEKGCEIAVIETGLGGRLDPTNIVKSPLASVITSIGLDHMQYLGDTIEKIAMEKCGIIKENSPVILYPLNDENVIETVRNTAFEKNCEFIMPDINSLKILEENIDFTQFEYKNKIYKIKLAGRHQVYNAITVIETMKKYSPLHETAIYNGIEKTFFPSRFEILLRKPTVIFDGAHNISAVIVLKEAIKNLMPDKKIILICGMLRDKNPEEIIKNIAGESFVERFICVPVNSPRAETPENLCEYAAKYCKNAEYYDNLYDAIKKAVDLAASEDYAVVCFGSFYMAADVKKNVMKYKTP